ncbi:MAG: glycosyltransferase family 4 protein [Bacteroidota bacterium]|nr:glycosyltransferase family 4 protein [Bacteroidota bacterium]
MRKILIFTDWFLPGTKSGGPVRSYANLIAHFEGEYEFKVITRDTDYCSTEPYPGIACNHWNRWSTNTEVYYISQDQLNRETLKKLIDETDYDVVYINGIYSWKFSVLPLLLLKNCPVRIIVAARGMLNPQAFSVKKTKKKVFLAFAKMLKLYRNVTFHATNEDEQRYIREITGQGQPVIVAPNLPRKVQVQTPNSRTKKANELKLVSVARISKEKGTLHALHALSKVQTGEVTLDLYGPVYDQAYWEECLSVVKGLPSRVKVNYKGSIDGEKVPDVLQDYHFFIMPSEGENFGHAILEALSCGCPVIISDMTPWKGLIDKNLGWDIPLNDPDGFVRAIETAAKMEQAVYQEWSSAASEYARIFCENPEVIAENRRLFDLS